MTTKPTADQIALLAAKQMSVGREATGRIIAAVIRNKAQVLMSTLETLHEGDQADSEAFRDGCEAVGALVAFANALEGR